jgi:catechol 2,3-dioxygenase-like lactoylglutathione lyase family enzyme
MLHHLDHLVLTTSQKEKSIDFYTRVLKMKLETFGQERIAFKFGEQKINLHIKGQEFEPKAHLPVPGALDLCIISSIPLEEVITHIQGCGWKIEEGPVKRTGANYPIRSIYLRDPDLNLIEISEQIQEK